jgi:hypothetical protein
MSNIRNYAISMNEIYELVNNLAGHSAPPVVPHIDKVREQYEAGPKTMFTIDLTEDCWGIFREMSAAIELPPFGEHAEITPDREWWHHEGMPECLPTLSKVHVLGEYSPIKTAITYFDLPMIHADRREIVRFHERMHAIHHLIPDANGKIWNGFPRISRCAIEMLAQIFTYKFLEHRRDQSLMDEMTSMAHGQGALYRMPLEILNSHRMSDADCLDLYWDIRVHGKLRGGFGDYCKYLQQLLVDARPGAPINRSASDSGRVKPAKDDRIFRGNGEHTGSGGAVAPGSDATSASPGQAHPFYLFTYEPLAGDENNVEACLSSQRLYDSSENIDTEPAPGAHGFLRDGNSGFVAIIEITGGWTPDLGKQGTKFLPFRVVERWHPDLPFAVMNKYKGKRRLSRPVHAFKDTADVDMILVAHDAMLEGFGKARNDVRDFANKTINEVIRKVLGE